MRTLEMLQDTHEMLQSTHENAATTSMKEGMKWMNESISGGMDEWMNWNAMNDWMDEWVGEGNKACRNDGMKWHNVWTNTLNIKMTLNQWYNAIGIAGQFNFFCIKCHRPVDAIDWNRNVNMFEPNLKWNSTKLPNRFQCSTDMHFWCRIFATPSFRSRKWMCERAVNDDPKQHVQKPRRNCISKKPLSRLGSLFLHPSSYSSSSHRSRTWFTFSSSE